MEFIFGNSGSSYGLLHSTNNEDGAISEYLQGISLFGTPVSENLYAYKAHTDGTTVTTIFNMFSGDTKFDRPSFYNHAKWSKTDKEYFLHRAFFEKMLSGFAMQNDIDQLRKTNSLGTIPDIPAIAADAFDNDLILCTLNAIHSNEKIVVGLDVAGNAENFDNYARGFIKRLFEHLNVNLRILTSYITSCDVARFKASDYRLCVVPADFLNGRNHGLTIIDKASQPPDNKWSSYLNWIIGLDVYERDQFFLEYERLIGRYTNISKSLLEYYDVRKSIGDVSKLLLKHTDEPNFAVPENQKEKLRKHHSVRSGFIMGDVQIDFDNIEDFTKSNRAKLKYLGHVYGEKPIPELESIISESFRSLSLEWGEIESILQFINNAQGQSGINKVVRERIAVHAAELLSGVLEEYGRQSEELETANDKIDQLGRDLYAVEDTINAANKEIDQLGRDLYAAKDTINAANEERERLEGELDTANAEKEVLKGKLNTAYEKIDQLDRESKVAQGTINEYETMLQAANDKKEELQSKVTDTEEKFSAAEKEVEELNKELKKANKNKPLRTSLSRLNQNLKEETKLYQINDERRITTFIKKEAYKWVFDNIKKYEPQTKDTEDLCKQIKQSEGFTEDTTYTTYYEALANNFENNPFADKIKIDRRKPIITDDIQMYFVEYNGVKLPIGFMFDFFESDYEGKDNQDRREDVIKGFLADAKKTTLLNWDIAESDFKDKIKQATEEKFANITNFNGKDWLKFGLWTVVKTACVLALVFVSFEIFGIIEEIEEEVSMWLQPWFYFSLVIFSVLGLYGIYLLYLLGEVRLFKIGLLSVQLAFSEHHNLSKDCKNTGIQKMETHLQNVIDSANHKTRNLEITDSDTDAEEMFAELAIFNDQLDNNEKRYEKLNNVIGAYKTGFVWRWLFFAFTIITVVLYIYLT